jgi:hypothetical protein
VKNECGSIQFQMDMPVLLPNVVAATDPTFERGPGNLHGCVIVFGAQFINAKDVAAVIEEEEPKRLHGLTLLEAVTMHLDWDQQSAACRMSLAG